MKYVLNEIDITPIDFVAGPNPVTQSALSIYYACERYLSHSTVQLLLENNMFIEDVKTRAYNAVRSMSDDDFELVKRICKDYSLRDSNYERDNIPVINYSMFIPKMHEETVLELSVSCATFDRVPTKQEFCDSILSIDYRRFINI